MNISKQHYDDLTVSIARAHLETMAYECWFGYGSLLILGMIILVRALLGMQYFKLSGDIRHQDIWHLLCACMDVGCGWAYSLLSDTHIHSFTPITPSLANAGIFLCTDSILT